MNFWPFFDQKPPLKTPPKNPKIGPMRGLAAGEYSHRGNIFSLRFQPSDVYSYFHANAESSVLDLLPPLFELLHCRDGSLSLSSEEFCMVDISSMIASICTC